MGSDVLITLAVIGLNVWLWWKRPIGFFKLLLIAAFSAGFLWWFNYGRKYLSIFGGGQKAPSNPDPGATP